MDEWTDEWVMKKDFWRSALKEKLSTFKISHFFSFFFSSEAHAAKFLLPTVGVGWWGGWRWWWRWGLTCPMVISRPSSPMTVFFFLSLHLSLCLWRQRKEEEGEGGVWEEEVQSLCDHRFTLPPRRNPAPLARHCVLMVITLEPHRRRNNWHF